MHTVDTSGDVACKVCTIRLEQLCYQRAWWFRAFRELLATGVRVFALFYRIKPGDYRMRSPLCHQCLRFKKNALKTRSPTFRGLDGWVNPLFNRVRDSLLSAEELEQARSFARQAENTGFTGDSNRQLGGELPRTQS
jgi:hypothetical protein